MMMLMMMITMMTLSENTAHPKTKAVLVPYSQSGYHLLQSRLEGASSLYKAKRPKNQHHSLSKRRCSSQTQKAAAICPPKANETQNSNAKHLGTNDVRSILVHIYIHSSPETKRHFHIHTVNREFHKYATTESVRWFVVHYQIPSLEDQFLGTSDMIPVASLLLAQMDKSFPASRACKQPRVAGNVESLRGHQPGVIRQVTC